MKIKEEILQSGISSFFGVFRRGNKPPVLPGDNKKLQQKKNLRDIIVNGLATALLEIYHGGF